MVQADYLFLMTDVDCLYDKNPRSNPTAKPIEVISDISSLEADVSSVGSALGTGGMMTKIVAARLATSAGVTTVITKSSKPGNIYNIISYLQTLKTPPRTDSPAPDALPAAMSTAETNGVSDLPYPPQSTPLPPLHTRFLPIPIPIRNRQFWLLHGLAPHGTLYIDHGAYRALKNKHGLLPVGIIDIEGSFSQQEAVRIVVADRPHAQMHSRNPSSHTTAPVPLMEDSTIRSITPIPDLVDPHSNSNPSSRPHTPSRNPPSRSKTPTPTSSSLQHADSTQSLKVHSEVGRALVNYSSTEIARIKGLQSTEIGAVLGYADSEYVALRENVSLSERAEKGGGGEEKVVGEEREKERDRERMGALADFA
jgi:glutamate 5-kinase